MADSKDEIVRMATERLGDRPFLTARDSPLDIAMVSRAFTIQSERLAAHKAAEAYEVQALKDLVETLQQQRDVLQRERDHLAGMSLRLASNALDEALNPQPQVDVLDQPLTVDIDQGPIRFGTVRDLVGMWRNQRQTITDLHKQRQRIAASLLEFGEEVKEGRS